MTLNATPTFSACGTVVPLLVTSGSVKALDLLRTELIAEECLWSLTVKIIVSSEKRLKGPDIPA